MRLLDLFCGAGGAAMGYSRAGFEVIGVDNKPQKHYPFEFHQADAFDYLRDHGKEFDVIHASPPCQAFSSLQNMWNAKKHMDQLTPITAALMAIDKPWVVENVPGAPIIHPLILCGTMFGLRTVDGAGELRRHRLFDSNSVWGLTPQCQHNGPVIGFYGSHGRDRRRTVPVSQNPDINKRRETVTATSHCDTSITARRRRAVIVTGHCGGYSRRDGVQSFTVDKRKEAMGIDWMTGDELSQAIPPAYTEWIGKRLLEQIRK